MTHQHHSDPRYYMGRDDLMRDLKAQVDEAVEIGLKASKAAIAKLRDDLAVEQEVSRRLLRRLADMEIEKRQASTP